MKAKRGDVVLTVYPFASGTGSSRRPALVVQSNAENQRLRNTIVVQITSNVRRAAEPTHLLIEAATPEGVEIGIAPRFFGLCINLATVHEDRIDKIIGSLSPQAMQKIDDCLKAALGLP